MKNINKIFIFFSILVFLPIWSIAKDINISVENRLSIKRLETVSININNSNFLKMENLGVFDEFSKQIVSQLVDSNGDGIDDEIIFQDEFEPFEIKTYSIKESLSKNKFQSMVFVSFIEGREDIAWESNKIAYRMYGPPLKMEVKNGIDVWAKRVESLVVAKWYKEESEGQSYHIDNGEGADFFSVGKSLGCGGSTLMINDSLYQAGVYDKFRIVENGPIRAKFILTYNYDILGKHIVENKTISIEANSYLNKIETNYSIIPSNSKFVIGLVKRDNIYSISDYDNQIIALWGDISQNKNDGQLGMGVVVLSQNKIQVVEDDKHLMIEIKNDMNNASKYYAGAGWSRQSDGFDKDGWQKYLKSFKVRLANPLVINVIE